MTKVILSSIIISLAIISNVPAVSAAEIQWCKFHTISGKQLGSACYKSEKTCKSTLGSYQKCVAVSK
jgi:hypothetical protein